MRSDIAETDCQCSDNDEIDSVDIRETFGLRKDQCPDTDEEKEDESLHHEFALYMVKTSCFWSQLHTPYNYTYWALCVEKSQVISKSNKDDDRHGHATDTNLSSNSDFIRHIPKSLVDKLHRRFPGERAQIGYNLLSRRRFWRTKTHNSTKS